VDPIDGTRGLVRGDQFAIAVALVIDGRVEVAVVACPRLPPDGPRTETRGPGYLVHAVRGEGAWGAPLTGERVERLHVSQRAAPSEARLLRSFEARHTDVPRLEAAARALGLTSPAVLMDSQAKYVVLAAGDADLLLRFPSSPGYRDAIWDHAAGSLIVEEAGGRLTDLDGRPLDFTAGRRLTRNTGIIATNGLLHDAALAAVHVPSGGRAGGGRWEHFPHEADIGVIGAGATKAEAFRQAALALTAIVTDPARVRPQEAVAIACEASSDELLLVEWLDAIVYEMAVRRMLFAEFTVEIHDGRLQAVARGEPVDVGRHEPAVEIKGATLTALEVARDGGGWRVRCVVDV
jgi:3'-phosphoadenosine 5'-phosphosulfate (PAPS) 3'-phosphatase/SHS2 domain-containing protein